MAGSNSKPIMFLPVSEKRTIFPVLKNERITLEKLGNKPRFQRFRIVPLVKWCIPKIWLPQAIGFPLIIIINQFGMFLGSTILGNLQDYNRNDP